MVDYHSLLERVSPGNIEVLSCVLITKLIVVPMCNMPTMSRS